MIETVELRVSYRYVKEHPWVIQGITGFLSAYFMEKPGFQVRKQFEEIETGMHVWICDVPPDMKFPKLLKRLKFDIPPCHTSHSSLTTESPSHYLIDTPEDISSE